VNSYKQQTEAREKLDFW